MKEGEKEKKGEKKEKQDEASLGQVWKMVIFPRAQGTELAVCYRSSRRIAKEDGDDGEMAASGSASEREMMGRGGFTKVETAKGEDRAEMKKEAKLLRYTLLNESAWSMERKYMSR